MPKVTVNEISARKRTFSSAIEEFLQAENPASQESIALAFRDFTDLYQKLYKEHEKDALLSLKELVHALLKTARDRVDVQTSAEQKIFCLNNYLVLYHYAYPFLGQQRDWRREFFGSNSSPDSLTKEITAHRAFKQKNKTLFEQFNTSEKTPVFIESCYQIGEMIVSKKAERERRTVWQQILGEESPTADVINGLMEVCHTLEEQDLFRNPEAYYNNFGGNSFFALFNHLQDIKDLSESLKKLQQKDLLTPSGLVLFLLLFTTRESAKNLGDVIILSVEDIMTPGRKLSVPLSVDGLMDSAYYKKHTLKTIVEYLFQTQLLTAPYMTHFFKYAQWAESYEYILYILKDNNLLKPQIINDLLLRNPESLQTIGDSLNILAKAKLLTDKKVLILFQYPEEINALLQQLGTTLNSEDIAAIFNSERIAGIKLAREQKYQKLLTSCKYTGETLPSYQQHTDTNQSAVVDTDLNPIVPTTTSSVDNNVAAGSLTTNSAKNK